MKKILFLIPVIAFFLPLVAQAAITFDISSAGTYTAPGTATMSWSHTVGASANILVVYTGDYINGNVSNIPTVTYNGVSMTRATTKCASGFDSSYCDQMWYLVNPAVGAHSIVVTAPLNNTYLSGGAWSFNGVDTSNPVDVTNFGEGVGTINPTVSVTTNNANEFITYGETNANNANATGSTGSFDWVPGSPVAALNIAGGHQGPVSIGSVASTFTMSSSNWITLGLALKPQAAIVTTSNEVWSFLFGNWSIMGGTWSIM